MNENWNMERLQNLPNLAAMIVLIAILVLLQRRQPRLQINSWILALFLVLLSQISWYFTKFHDRDNYLVFHTFRLAIDMLAGLAFMLYTGRSMLNSRARLKFLAWNFVGFGGIECLYGLDVSRLDPYIVCAVIGATIGVMTEIHYKKSWIGVASQLGWWTAIALLAIRGNYRAAAYWALAAVFAAAAINLWKHLRPRGAGRVTMVTSLGIWSASFLVHPWLLHYPLYRPLSEQIWSLQKFFVAIGMLICLLENEIKINERMAIHDQLTGLPNRRVVRRRLLETIGTGKASATMIDLDGFKQFNDSLGHTAGDKLLRQIAERLRAVVGRDGVLARMGGDEFVVVSNTDGDAIAPAIERALMEPFVVDEVQTRVCASVGTSRYPEDAEGAIGEAAVDILLQSADRRMYASKRARWPRQAIDPCDPVLR
jgi:diguanylate cyclase (GGDEF)-like protein